MGFVFSKLLRMFNCPSPSGETHIKDRISQLPDDILFSLLSHLSLKEVGRLSVLSRRYRYPWKHSTRLDFENDEINEQKLVLNEFDKTNFVKWVNLVLESHDTTKLEHVRISYGLGKEYKNDLDKWLKIIFLKQVQSVDLELRLRDMQTNYLRDSYTITPDIFSRTDARGGLIVDESFIGLKSLKSLRLTWLKLTCAFVEFLLNNCPALECLHIVYNLTSVNFKVTGKRHIAPLRVLELAGNFGNIEISDVVNLVSFKCHGWVAEPKLVLKNVPSLVNLHLSGYWPNYYLNSRMNNVMVPLSGFLKSLTLHLSTDLVVIDPRDQKHIIFGWPKLDYEFNREVAARQLAKKQLKGKAPKGVQLVIL